MSYRLSRTSRIKGQATKAARKSAAGAIIKAANRRSLSARRPRGRPGRSAGARSGSSAVGARVGMDMATPAGALRRGGPRRVAGHPGGLAADDALDLRLRVVQEFLSVSARDGLLQHGSENGVDDLLPLV